MKRCTVEFVSRGGGINRSQFDATSLYDAVEQMVNRWAKLWQFNADADFVVWFDDQVRLVTKTAFREWLKRKRDLPEPARRC